LKLVNEKKRIYHGDTEGTELHGEKGSGFSGFKDDQDGRETGGT
jgi:hypothetical protein